MSDNNPRPRSSTDAVEVHPKDQSGVEVEGPPNGSPAEAKSSAEMSPDPNAKSGTSKARRSGRISRKIPIALHGDDAEGRAFREQTHTVVVSCHGAGVVSKHLLAPEQELVLRWAEAGREARVRVVGEIGAHGGLHAYGLEFVDQDVDLWQMELPPAPQSGNQPSMLVECLGCDEVFEIPSGDFEYDICMIHGGLTKYCSKCGCLSVWTRTTEQEMLMRWLGPEGPVEVAGIEAGALGAEGAIEEQGAPVASVDENKPAEAVALSSAGAATPKTTERRTRLRVPVNFLACVRSETFGDELVSCVDMSRGGVAFQSGNRYRKESMVEIAVPFAAEARSAPSIFVTARITNVLRLANGAYRCGVEFLREKKREAETT